MPALAFIPFESYSFEYGCYERGITLWKTFGFGRRSVELGTQIWMHTVLFWVNGTEMMLLSLQVWWQSVIWNGSDGVSAASDTPLYRTLHGAVTEWFNHFPDLIFRKCSSLRGWILMMICFSPRFRLGPSEFQLRQTPQFLALFL